MATKRMLIDATHPEETRVVVLNGNRLEEFDVEAEARKQLKGNIYLAKVTRVEPSLQAAFVEYGGNRHGFLAFNEIHPDYYQIPVADREALMAEHDDGNQDDDDDDEQGDGDKPVETVGGDDSEDVQARRPVPLHRRYKIQEVIKRRQILLIQVVKEERGNKGAALTTYISLAGRYCVLMPNTARGGGISRKISSGADRKRLKSIVAELSVPDGMAVIVRTAGSQRSKAEIRRDNDYLLRLWDQIRETTLSSTAPCLVHEEANLVRRAIRDLYDSSIEEVIVEGDSGYRLAKDFMKLLIPSHAKKVQPYKDNQMPLFYRYQVESQLDAMHSPTVQLRSGGYIVINPTEALVSIDVNSGRATRERNIEETALKTNLEAAEEIARQLRLRDLAGLIVIDFIDMEVHRNQTAVERRMKDAMRSDRARIQIGRISAFGLLELSRQRLRPSLLETSSSPCPHCDGTGQLRSVESSALTVLRAVEEEGIRRRASAIAVHVANDIALYILNQKRDALARIEERYSFSVMFRADDKLIAPNHRMERLQGRIAVDGEEAPEELPEQTISVETEASEGSEEERGKRRRRRRRRGRRDEAETQPETTTDTDQDEAAEGEDEAPVITADDNGDDEQDAPRKRRRRGRRGGRRRRRGGPEEADSNAEATAEGSDTAYAEEGDASVTPSEVGTESVVIEIPIQVTEDTPDGEAALDIAQPGTEVADAAQVDAALVDAAQVDAAQADTDLAEEEKPKRRRTRRKAAPKTEAEGEATGDTVETEAAEEKPKKAPAKRRSPRRKKAEETATEEAPAAETPVEEAPVAEPIEVSAAPEPASEPMAEGPVMETVAAEAPVVEEAADPEPAVNPEAAKTTVVSIDEVKPAEPKRGWWRRLTE
ncbi:MAG: Rne/Rng family ribonuclease [Magnetovibrionaceae bacterium]